MPLAMSDKPLAQENQSKSNEVSFFVHLISNGQLGYQKTLEFRPMKIRDFEILASSNNEGPEYYKKLINVVQNCCLTQGVRIDRLSIQDFNEVLIALRVNSTGKNTYELTVKCPECRKGFDHTVYLSMLPVKEIDPIFVEPFKTDSELDVRMPRCSIYTNDRYHKSESSLLLAMIESALGRSIGNDTISVISEVKNILDTYDYGIDLTIKIKCPHCEKEVGEFSIPFRWQFFIT